MNEAIPQDFRNHFNIPGRSTTGQAPAGGAPATDWATLIPGYFQEAFGRTPDEAEIADWVTAAQDGKFTPDALLAHLKTFDEHKAYAASQAKAAQDAEAARRAQFMTPEFINGLLGPSTAGGWQDEARKANFGINQMPGIFSDYANPILATGDPQSQGNVLIQGLLSQLPDLFKQTTKDPKGLLDTLTKKA